MKSDEDINELHRRGSHTEGNRSGQLVNVDDEDIRYIPIAEVFFGKSGEIGI